MTDVASVLCLFEEASLCLMDRLRVVDKRMIFHLLCLFVFTQAFKGANKRFVPWRAMSQLNLSSLKVHPLKDI